MTSAPKVVLVTGCSRGGIGFHLCERFASSGCIVYATARRAESMTGLSENIKKLTLDVTNEQDIVTAVQTIVTAEGRIDVVVNNAGMICIGATVDVTAEQAKTTFETNFFSVLNMSRAVIPHMAARRRGLVVNVGSIVGEIPTPWNGIYSASKAAVHSLTEVLYMECKPLNIDVMLVSPGSVKSNIAENSRVKFSVPPSSLYKDYLSQMIRRMSLSQGRGSMDTAEFANQVVLRALSPRPPRYVRLGGNTTLFRWLAWLPRTLVLSLIWFLFARK